MVGSKAQTDEGTREWSSSRKETNRDCSGEGQGV